MAATAGAMLLLVESAFAVDLEAGRNTAAAKCGECHAAKDWEGEDASALEDLIRDIVAGKVKHRTKLELSASDIANIAAFWAESSNKKPRVDRRS